MTNTKDKLSASVRQAKAAQNPDADAPVAAAAAKPADKVAATAAKPRPAAPRKQAAPRKPAASKPAVQKPADAAQKVKAAGSTGTRKSAAAKRPQPDEIPESGSALFPKRVWPD